MACLSMAIRSDAPEMLQSSEIRKPPEWPGISRFYFSAGDTAPDTLRSAAQFHDGIHFHLRAFGQ
jgi:hypothetical protein